MDTKLKNRHRLGVFVIAMTIFLVTILTVTNYSRWYWQSEESEEDVRHEQVTSQEFLENFFSATYVLYSYETYGQEQIQEFVQDDEDIYDNFAGMNPYLDYTILDENEEVLTSNEVAATSGVTVTEENMGSYTTALKIHFDKAGTPHVELRKGEFPEEQMRTLREIVNNRGSYQEIRYWGYDDETSEEVDVAVCTPVNRTYLLAMDEENQSEYLDEVLSYTSFGEKTTCENIAIWLLGMGCLIALAACAYPKIELFQTGEEAVFRAPVDVLLVGTIFLSEIVIYVSWNRVIWGQGKETVFDIVLWSAVYTVIYWLVGCLRPLRHMRLKQYLKERTFLATTGRTFLKKIKTKVKIFYQSLKQIDLTKKEDKTIKKIIIVNFVIVAFLCCTWVFGIVGLLIYSAVLYVFLRRYYYDLQKKYALLLKATNEIAEGNLDVEVKEDLGIFEPFKPEISKIQEGFKAAVEKEVKSQQMKTELVTNVSHDLKTPLTAIITYVNLLKEETDETIRKEYVEVLDRKSMRLKVLIEDLFEISKASSKNTTLQIAEVDVVNLFKQVKLETEEKFRDSNLEFRCHYPETPVIVPLDGQKTYRIFENLLVNVAKYAMPGTRVYVEIEEEKESVTVKIKNVSRQELSFDPNEITERFVRGDAARNTEGSGLGLAIAKSFTELQKGEFKIEIDGDLFKANVKFRT